MYTLMSIYKDIRSSRSNELLIQNLYKVSKTKAINKVAGCCYPFSEHCWGYTGRFFGPGFCLFKSSTTTKEPKSPKLAVVATKKLPKLPVVAPKSHRNWLWLPPKNHRNCLWLSPKSHRNSTWLQSKKYNFQKSNFYIFWRFSITIMGF